MTELFSRVHPGSAFALLDNNPNHAVVFDWLQQCRQGTFQPLEVVRPFQIAPISSTS
jgi:hypothetical protein